LTHADLTACTADEAWRQISESKAAVEAVTGEPATAFCYPYGRHSAQTRDMVKRAGYKTACSTLKGLNSQDTDPFALKRINVRRDTSVFILLVKLLRGALLDR
jgi:peptidoglycan/xylan/chitin deacetylase (PgdA/CDA1 family)